MSLLTVFKNAGPNYSFGRVFAGASIMVGLFILVLVVLGAYRFPTKAVEVKRYDPPTKAIYLETVMVPEHDWSGLNSLLLGITALAGTVYGLTKGTQVARDMIGKNGPPAPPPA